MSRKEAEPPEPSRESQCIPAESVWHDKATTATSLGHVVLSPELSNGHLRPSAFFRLLSENLSRVVVVVVVVVVAAVVVVVVVGVGLVE